MKTLKVKTGGALICNDKEGVTGAVVKYNNKNSILTVYHVLMAGNCNLGDNLKINGFKFKVTEILVDYDLAIAEIYAPESALEFSSIGTPEIGP
ncbi:MAG: hypothetical protein ACPK7O_03490 [Methanobacterium sp.]